MATIRTAIALYDGVTGPLRNMQKAIDATAQAFENIEQISGRSIDVSAVHMAQESLNEMNTACQTLEQNVQACSREQQSFNGSIRAGNSAAGNLVKTIAGLSLVQSAIRLVKGQLDSAINRMDTMTNFNRTMTAITGSADAAAASLASLKDMTKGTAFGLDTAAAAVQNFTTRGMNIGAATAEVGKWADAVAFYGDGTNDTLTNVTDAIGKMFTKGKVEMDQLDRLTDAGINAVGIYAQAVGRNAASVQDDLSKGAISAQDFVTTVSTAFEEGTNGVLNIAGAAKEAGGTWATSIANAKAAITRGLIDMIESINEGLSQAGFGTILDGITEFGAGAETVLSKIGIGIENIIILLSPLLHGIQTIGSFIVDNWSTILPILGGLAGAFVVFQVAAHWTQIAAAAAAIYHGVINFLSLGFGVLTGKAAAASAAVFQFNSSLMGSRITWAIMLITVLIGVFYAAVAAVNKFKGTSVSATGVICGAFAVLLAFIQNSVMIPMWNTFASTANFLLNVFNDPIAAVKVAFYDMCLTVLGYFRVLAHGIENLLNKIPGVSVTITGSLDSLYSDLQKSRRKTITESGYVEYFKRKDYVDYSDAFSGGYQFGQRVADRVSGMFHNNSTVDTDIPTALDGIYQNTADTAKDTAAIADALDITKSELKYIRDFAEAKAINRYTTAEIKINMTNHNNINSDSDIDSFVIKLRDKLEEEMLASAEGVH